MEIIEVKIEQAKEFLQKFYRVRGIEDNNIREKFREMNEHVRIPNFDYSKKTPALYEIEQQYLKDSGFNV